MSVAAQYQGDVLINGSLYATGLTIPNSSIRDASVAAGAGISAAKIQQQEIQLFAQDFTTTIVAQRHLIHWAKGGNGTIQEFRVTVTTAMIGAATATIDLKKNGTTILTSSITIDSTLVAFVIKNPAGYTSLTYVANDFFEVEILTAVAGGGTLAKGFSSALIVREDPQ
jgi:hypothetical protein